jgi:tRNA uridine 5-carboxymethylaminomethyl modification enzyme
MNNKYDIIVIGAGHAGIEAAYTSAKMGSKVAVLTMDFDTMGRPSCNPSIGGSAKGHLVKEIDALGGAMGFLADKAGIQFKTLNKSKGPAVWSPRSQIDKDLYPRYVKQLLFSIPNITMIQGTADDIIVKNDKVKGVITDKNEIIFAEAVILCAGTFLKGRLYTGQEEVIGGRVGEKSADKISDMLNAYGLEKGRLKTGTPPRVFADSINYDKTDFAFGDEIPEPFSYRTSQVKNRIICYQSSTNTVTHDILRTGFEESPMFTGRIKGVGPRYCPSIEDKIDRFASRPSHKILLEPEGLNTESVYVNGYSTSLPIDVQIKGLHSIKGLENARLMRPGYAVEYDFFYPYQLKFTMETKAIEGLYFAGQINGTSGYEEAAAQGIIAGINAHNKIHDKNNLVLKRSEAYIGVLIDDLVNKSTEEPYRIFTSLAEYRLLLRADNADERLVKYGFKNNLVSERYYEKVMDRMKKTEKGIEEIKNIFVKPEEINDYLTGAGENTIQNKESLYNIAKRGKADLNEIANIISLNGISKDAKIIEKIKIFVKYEGYIKRQLKEIAKFAENENKKIPENMDYNKITSLSNEAREKLIKIRPASLGQASRISGVSAADVSILSIFLK